jgi:O-antigen ligase
MNETARPHYLTVAFALYAASTLISQAVMSVGAALLGVALLFALGGPAGLFRELRAGWSNHWVRRYTLLSLALLAACALSLIVAKFAPLGWNGHYVEPHFLSDMAKSWYFAWPLLLVAGLRRLSDSDRTTVLRSWLVTFAVVSAIGIAQHYTAWPRLQEIPDDRKHFHATMFLGHHLSVASILIFPFFATLDFLRNGTTRIFSRPALAGCACLGFGALIMTYSRMLWIALPLGLVLWALRGLSRKQRLGVAIAFVLTIVSASQLPFVQSRMKAAIGIGDRQALWRANFEFLRLRPFTGAGFRRNIDASSYYLESLPNTGWVFSGHAHNNLIDMLGGVGVLGAVAWLAWCVGVFWLLSQGLKRRVRSHDFGWGLVCAWLVFHLNGLTQVNFWEGKVMHQMMWVLAWALLWVIEEPDTEFTRVRV